MIAEDRVFTQWRVASGKDIDERVDVARVTCHVVPAEKDDIGSSRDQLSDECLEHRRMGRGSGVKIRGECNHQRCGQSLCRGDLDFLPGHTEFAVESEVVTPSCHQAPQEHGVECGHHEFPGAGIVFAAA